MLRNVSQYTYIIQHQYVLNSRVCKAITGGCPNGTTQKQLRSSSSKHREGTIGRFDVEVFWKLRGSLGHLLDTFAGPLNDHFWRISSDRERVA